MINFQYYEFISISYQKSNWKSESQKKVKNIFNFNSLTVCHLKNILKIFSHQHLRRIVKPRTFAPRFQNNADNETKKVESSNEKVGFRSSVGRAIHF